jgi:YHS domain-containing protein
VIRLIVWLILASLVLRSILRLLRGVAEGLQGPSAPKPPAAVPLVRDPVCGTYVVPSNALSAGSGPQMKFFCSENCRRAYAMKIAQ